MRNLCLVGPPNTMKSYLYKPLSLIYNTYSRPDGGSYQLEELIGKELFFLNDLEYDEDAKKWCSWQYFKRFLEGEALTVSIPKNRGGNQDFTSDAPVFITAPQEISLYRGKKRDDYETSQIAARVKYEYLSHPVPESERKETAACAHCGARCYLEGGKAAFSFQPAALEADPRSSRQTSQASTDLPQSPVKKARCGTEVLEALKEVQGLKTSGLLDTPEAKALKNKILRDL